MRRHARRRATSLRITRHRVHGVTDDRHHLTGLLLHRRKPRFPGPQTGFVSRHSPLVRGTYSSPFTEPAESGSDPRSPRRPTRLLGQDPRTPHIPASSRTGRPVGLNRGLNAALSEHGRRRILPRYVREVIVEEDRERLQINRAGLIGLRGSEGHYWTNNVHLSAWSARFCARTSSVGTGSKLTYEPNDATLSDSNAESTETAVLDARLCLDS